MMGCGLQRTSRMNADVSRTADYEDNHVASFPWKCLVGMCVSEIPFQVAGPCGFDRRVGSFVRSVSMRIMTYKMFPADERKNRGDYFKNTIHWTRKKGASHPPSDFLGQVR